MKHLLLPFLVVLGLPAVAQYRPMNSTPRTYTPSYSSPSVILNLTGPGSNYRAQQQTQQQAHQNFQRMQAQQMQQGMQMRQRWQQSQQQMQQEQLQRQQLNWLSTLGASKKGGRPAQTMEEAQAEQQQAEQQATTQLADLAKEQQRYRQENPAATPAEAEAQRQADTRQLTRLAVKNYQDVFLPGQLLSASQLLLASPTTQEGFTTLGRDLLDGDWWSKQEAAQLQEKLTAHSATLTVLTTELLGFNAAALPPLPAPLAISPVTDQLSHDAFDQAAAGQLVREAALADKRLTGEWLALAVRDFNEVATRVAAGPIAPQDLKQRRDEVKASFQQVEKELRNYMASMNKPSRLVQVYNTLTQATKDYLASSGK